MGQRKVKLGRVTDVDLRLLRFSDRRSIAGDCRPRDRPRDRPFDHQHSSSPSSKGGSALVCAKRREKRLCTHQSAARRSTSFGSPDESLDVFRNEVNENQDAMAGELNVGIWTT